MKFTQTFALLGALASQVLAHKSCKSYKVPVTVTSTNMVYGEPHFKSNFDIAEIADVISSRTAADPATMFTGSKNVTASYEIGATFCTPTDKSAAHKDTVLIATHGLNFDRSYWDPQIDGDKYSFVDYAINKGYSIFYYDRLGVGESTQVSGYENQLSPQVAILQELTAQIKSTSCLTDITAKKVVYVGHSFGSSISLGALGQDESLADGLILTGFGFNQSVVNVVGLFLALQPRIAAEQHPGKWRQLDTGYITGVDLYSNINAFLRGPDYDHRVARFADDHKQPFALTEVFTAMAIERIPTTYKGPVMLLSGQYDFIFCTSNCDGGVLEVPASGIFSQAKDFKAISYPGAGHAVNLQLNAKGSFSEITDFLESNDL